MVAYTVDYRLFVYKKPGQNSMTLAAKLLQMGDIMKCVILAGGMQSTLTRDNESIPKPMIEIGGKPLIWHKRKQP